MMRVTIEIVPFGNEDEKYDIRTINIWNTGETMQSLGLTYHKYLWSDAHPDVIRGWLPDEREAKADGWTWHHREDGAEALVSDVLAP